MDYFAPRPVPAIYFEWAKNNLLYLNFIKFKKKFSYLPDAIARGRCDLLLVRLDSLPTS